MTLDSPKAEEDVEGNGEDYSEFKALLPPRKGGMSRNSDKVRRKVQWNDNNGNKLVEVLEFEPRFLLMYDNVDIASTSICRYLLDKLEGHSLQLRHDSCVKDWFQLLVAAGCKQIKSGIMNTLAACFA
ncbi:hypothetical protein POTOM_035661 [Populus tomentosa]|uniref:Uncharacterized protein n=1 Tax=Populus tomentosa TaxID=118781 RepID=A0A8X7Z0S0_POPTO|nr:hypothetical protein POTOM_035661 [Populus tomentosa]